MITDMTVGSPSKQLIKFTIPILFSVIFQQLYNIVDSIIAGNGIGKSALAAVGASYPITMIFMAFATGMNVGASVIISQYFGAKRYKQMKTAISTAIISTLILSAVLTVIGLLCSGSMLEMLSTPQNIMPSSRLYLDIYLWGLVFLFIYNIATGVFTALGDSKTPLILLILSSLGNIAGDAIFVYGFHSGVEGVALATLICQGVCSILAIVLLLLRVKKIRTEKYEKFSAMMLGKIAQIAVPSIIQNSFVSVGNLFIQGIINGYGEDLVAGYSAAIKINTFSVVCFSALGNGISNYTAQNIGAGKTKRVKSGMRAGLIMVAAIVAPIVTLLLLFNRQLLGLFMDSANADNRVAIETGMEFLTIVTPFYICVAVKLVCDGLLRGANCVRQFVITTFSDLVIRVVLAFILPGIWGSTGIWLSWPLGWIVGGGISLTFYLVGKWKKSIPISEKTADA